LKKKHINKAVESIIFIGMNERLKKTIHENMATVYNININKKNKSKTKVQIRVNKEF